MQFDPDMRFRDQVVILDGVEGANVEFDSVNPVNYHQLSVEGWESNPVTIDGKFFVPADADGPRPAVIVVPGSLGVALSHATHAQTLLQQGYVVFIVDPFGPRSVSSTVANQTQYSFAASAADVLAVWKVLQNRPEVEPSRIGAQGHSRGGSAVTMASMRRFADPLVGPDAGLAAVYAVYPWCGHQYVDPDVGSTEIRAIIGDQDEWCSVQQVQAQFQAISSSGGKASCRVVAGAHHSFDRHEPLTLVAEAKVAPTAPTVYLDDDGAMIDGDSEVADPDRTDRDSFVAAIKAGFGQEGAHIGATGEQPEVFRADMLSFFERSLPGQ